jgi:hypothetical protein
MMYACKTWSMTQNDSYIKYVEDEIFEQGVWTSNWVRYAELNKTPYFAVILGEVWSGCDLAKKVRIVGTHKKINEKWIGKDVQCT